MIAPSVQHYPEVGKKFILKYLLLVALSSLLASCGGEVEPDKFPDPGRVIVSVKDGSGRPVANVLCELKTPDLLLVWRFGVTDANGAVEIGQSDGGIIPGSYALAIKPPNGYVLATGQSNNIVVTVRSRTTSNLSVVLAVQ